MDTREAKCACGDVRVKLKGKADRVLICHCSYCKKATGSAFRVAAWFHKEKVVKIEGKTSVFNESERSKGIDFHFCVRCGSTIYWTFSHAKDYQAVAVGCFDDPDFPPPNFEFYTSKRICWIDAVKNVEQFEKWPPPDYLA